MLNVLRESYNKKIANIKMEIVDIKKNVINEDHNDWKNSRDRINSRLDEAEVQISDLEDKVVENTRSEQEQEKRVKKMRIV